MPYRLASFSVTSTLSSPNATALPVVRSRRLTQRERTADVRGTMTLTRVFSVAEVEPPLPRASIVRRATRSTRRAPASRRRATTAPTSFSAASASMPTVVS